MAEACEACPGRPLPVQDLLPVPSLAGSVAKSAVGESAATRAAFRRSSYARPLALLIFGASQLLPKSLVEFRMPSDRRALDQVGVAFGHAR